MADDKILISLEAEDNASDKVNKVIKSFKDLQDANADVEKSAEKSGNAASDMASDYSKSASTMSNSMKNTSSDIASNLSSLVKGFEDGVTKINNATRRYNTIMYDMNRLTRDALLDIGSSIADFTQEAIDNYTKFSEEHARTLGAMQSNYANTPQGQAQFTADAGIMQQQALYYGRYGVNGTGSLLSDQQVAQAQTELIKAGVSTDQITSSDMLPEVLEFAQANELSTETATSFAVTLSNQFGVPDDEIGDMLDMVSKTADVSVIDVEDIIQSMKYASGISAGLDRPMEETLGVIATLGNFGLKGSQGGTGYQAMLTRMLTGDTAVLSDNTAAAAPEGIVDTFYEFEDSIKPDGNLLPLEDVIPELESVMADMNDEEQAWFAKRLFGLYQMKSAYALANGEVDLGAVIEDIGNNSEGTNEQKLDQLLQSQYGQLTSLGNLWEGTKTDVGQRLAPVVDSIRDELFNYLGDPNSYEINLENIRGALEESSDLIEEQYGQAIGDAVRNVGNFGIDLSTVGIELAPDAFDGVSNMLSSLVDFDFLGDGGVFDDWNSMIENMDESVLDLPEEFQELGGSVVDVIDWFGKLTALNMASSIAELISSVLQIIQIAGGAIVNVTGAVIVKGGGTVPGLPGTGTGGGSSTSTTGSGTTTSKSTTGTKNVVDSVDDVLANTVDDVANGADDVAKAGSSVGKYSGYLGKYLSGAAKVLGVVGTAYTVYDTVASASEEYASGDVQGAGKEVAGGAGVLAGGFAGAKGGAALGTLIYPGIGTAIGGVVGSVAGALVGDAAISEAYDSMLDSSNSMSTVADKWSQYLTEVNTSHPDYNSKYDTNDSGSYHVWTGTQSQLDQYKQWKGQSFGGGATDQRYNPVNQVPVGSSDINPYTAEQVNMTPTNATITASSVDMNSTGTITGMPDINSLVKNIMPQGYNALSNQGKEDLVQNTIQNEMQVDNTVNMQPQFSVSAPVVNVDVKVDQASNVTKSTSVLSSGFGTALSNWYKTETSRYVSSKED